MGVSVNKASITFIPGYPWKQNNDNDCVFWEKIREFHIVMQNKL